MQNVTKEDIDILIRLQEIEKEAGKIQKLLDGVESEINIRKKKRKDAENELKLFETELEGIKKEYQEFEQEVKEREIRLRKSEDYLKIVKTNTEYQTLLREIDDNKKKNSDIESRMIEYLETIEKKESEASESRIRFEAISRTTDSEITEIQNTCVNERSELEKITAVRDEVAKEVNPRLLDRFNRILKQSAGLAIVPVTNSRCSGCFMNIPPQKFIEIQRAEALNFCPQCHRMLYFKP